MEPQQYPPPGWYPDPAGGPHHRHWDGMRWTPATWPASTPPNRNRRQVWVVAATVATVAAVLIVAVIVSVRSMLGPALSELTDAADDLTFPPGVTLVDESSEGNRMCLDECVNLTRTYTSPHPAVATIQIVVTALEKAGYRCVKPQNSSVDRDWCGNLEVNVLSYWQRGTDGFTIGFVAHPIPSTWASEGLSEIHVDPDSQSYFQVDI